MAQLHTVDHAAIKTGQVLAIATLTGAFIFNRWEGQIYYFPVNPVIMIFVSLSVGLPGLRLDK